MCDNEINLKKFPQFLRDAFSMYDLQFPDDTVWKYHPVKALRLVIWKEGRDPSITRDDFRSYAELGKEPRGTGKTEWRTIPNYYGVSLYSTYEQLKNAFNLPRPTKRVASGYVVQECGPMQPVNRKGHITWWLYEETDELLKDNFLIQEYEVYHE